MIKKKQTSKKSNQRTSKKKIEDFKIEVSQTRSDVETFIKKFKSDVDKKRKRHQLYAQKLQKKIPGV